MIKVIFVAALLTSCSGIRMERPEPEVYEALKSEKLFGLWENSQTKLNIRCTGRVEFLEMRNGKEFNKDEGSKVSKVDPQNSQLTFSGLFGSNTYHYRQIDEDTLVFLVGERAGWMEGMKVAASYMTIIPQDNEQRLKRKEAYDCDNEPQTLGEVFGDIGDKLKKGEFEVVEPKKP